MRKDINHHTQLEWKDIPGYEGLYQVSKTGGFVKRLVGYRCNTERIRKPSKHKFGYLLYLLSKDSKHKNIPVHRLVLLAFVGEPPPGMVCLHKDGNPQNNDLSNLRYGTISENVQDAIKHGTAVIGSKNGNAILNETQVAEIKRLCAEPNAVFANIARRYNVVPGAIYNIRKGLTWKRL